MRALFALFVRSVREDTRARLPILLRAALILIILLIVWANQRDFARRAAPGREFLGMVVFVNLCFIAIAALGSFPSAITEEKEDESLPLLRMTGLSPLAILFGKSTTQLLGALFLLAVQIPFTVLAVTLGGVSIGQVLSTYAILGATTFFLCNLALLGSVVCDTTIRAGIFTGIIGGMLFGFLPLVCIATALQKMVFGAVPQTAWQQFSTWVMEAHPAYALTVVLNPRLASYNIQKQVWPNLGAGLLCFLLSWMLFDRFCSAAAGTAGRRGRKKFTGFLRAIAGRRRPAPHRALAWKDFHFLIGGWRGLFIRFVLCGLTFLACYIHERWDKESPPPWPFADAASYNHYFWRHVAEETMVFAAIGFGIELSMLAAGIFGVERRALTLSGLVGLPRTTGWLIRQKLLGCLPILVPSAALFAVGLALNVIPMSIRAGWSPDDWFLFIIYRISTGLRLGLKSQDYILGLYFFSQALLLPLVIAFLSLRIRRGALPAGIAVIAVLNVFTVVITNSMRSRPDEDAVVFLIGFLSLGAACVMAVLIYRGIPRAAAAD